MELRTGDIVRCYQAPSSLWRVVDTDPSDETLAFCERLWQTDEDGVLLQHINDDSLFLQASDDVVNHRADELSTA